MTDTISVEVVAALPERQWLLELQLPGGSTVAEAIAASRLVERAPELPIADLQVAVWGKICGRKQVLRDGDRVELLRDLLMDPREARRQLALHGETMSSVTNRDPARGPVESR